MSRIERGLNQHRHAGILVGNHAAAAGPARHAVGGQEHNRDFLAQQLRHVAVALDGAPDQDAVDHARTHHLQMPPFRKVGVIDQNQLQALAVSGQSDLSAHDDRAEVVIEHPASPCPVNLHLRDMAGEECDGVRTFRIQPLGVDIRIVLQLLADFQNPLPLLLGYVRRRRVLKRPRNRGDRHSGQLCNLFDVHEIPPFSVTRFYYNSERFQCQYFSA